MDILRKFEGVDFKDMYNRLRDGDSISDEELKMLRDASLATMTILNKFGPTFRLARNEMAWVYDRADYLIVSRNNLRNNK